MRRIHGATSVLLTFALASSFLVLVGVAPAQAAAPTVLSFLPLTGPVGTSVAITGLGFNDGSPITAVTFNGTSALFTIDSGVQVTATVPAGATSGTISLTDAEGTSGSLTSFTVTPSPPPAVASFLPLNGPVGTQVTLTGTGFTGASAVSFNGTSATFGVDSDLQISTTVPLGATTGAISVTTPGGTSASISSFTVTASVTPAVTTFAPARGPRGRQVTITGSDLTGATDVTFAGVSAGFTVDSPTQITATVPAGAESGPIAVTTPGGTDSSPSSFTITPTPHRRHVSFAVGRRYIARGRVRAIDGYGACGARVGMRIQYLRHGGWHTVKRLTTGAGGRFHHRIAAVPHIYRAIVVRRHVSNGHDLCRAASSNARRVRA
jgi:hypothetical protein